MSNTTVEDVDAFLSNFRNEILKGSPIFYVNRRKNLRALIALSINANERDPYIQNLTSNDYSEGPLPDKSKHNGADVWVFGIRIGKEEIYIKITLSREQNPCTCISFHIAEYPMNYPLR